MAIAADPLIAAAPVVTVALAVICLAALGGLAVVLVLLGRATEEAQMLADETALLGRMRGPLAEIRAGLRDSADSLQRLRDR